MTLVDTTILITGANGWLGRRLVRSLTEGHAEFGTVGVGGARVRALTIPGEDTSMLSSLGVEIARGDVRDTDSVRKFMQGAESGTLLHLAGVIHPVHGTKEFMEVNFKGSANVIAAADEARVKRVVVMSSNSAVGASNNPAEVFDEDSSCRPYMYYGRSKLCMEEWIKERIGAGLGPEITIIRAPWFYGPEQPARQTRFFSMIKNGQFPLMGSGENRRSMAYIDSLAYGILLATSAEAAAGRVYWIADERPYRMKEIVDTVRDVLRDDFGMVVKPKTLRLPKSVADGGRLVDWSLQRMGIYNQSIHVLAEMNLTIACCVERAKRELGYRQLVELREGIRRSVTWCLESGRTI
jgi:nucleoside-diphosphate-sugar epimerase